MQRTRAWARILSAAEALAKEAATTGRNPAISRNIILFNDMINKQKDAQHYEKPFFTANRKMRKLSTKAITTRPQINVLLPHPAARAAGLNCIPHNNRVELLFFRRCLWKKIAFSFVTFLLAKQKKSKVTQGDSRLNFTDYKG